MRTIQVVAAVIIDSDKVLATQRGYGAYAGKWEFPGGKIELNETPVEALRREIREELNVEISVGDLITTVEHDYPDFHLSMRCFLATITSGSIALNEHLSAKWIHPGALYDIDWMPADIKVIGSIRDCLCARQPGG